VGYYGDREDEILTENEPQGNDFLSKLCGEWEQEAFRAQTKGVRVIAARFGIVLGKNGGAMKKMISAFNFFVGGPSETACNGFHGFTWTIDIRNHVRDRESRHQRSRQFLFPEFGKKQRFRKNPGEILNDPLLCRSCIHDSSGNGENSDQRY
jgi:hypothetical protein